MITRLNMATVESARSALLLHLANSAKRCCELKDVKDFVCKWYPSMEVEVVSVVSACTRGFALAPGQVFYF